MKHVTLFSGKRLIVRLALAVIMIATWGGQVWAGDILSISFENNNVPTDWDNGGTYGKSTYNEYSTSEDGIYSKQTYFYSTITSQNKIRIEKGQKITLNASLYPSGQTYPYLEIWYSFDGSSWSKMKEWNTNDGFTFGEVVPYSYIITDDKYKDGAYLQIRDKKVKIKSLMIEAAVPELTLIKEDVNPGEFKDSKVSSLTVKYTAHPGWNTICMPFVLENYSIHHMDDLFGTDWSAYKFSSFESNTLTFCPYENGQVDKNVPYLVFAPNATGSQVELNLTDVDVTYSSNPQTTADGVTFQGTYAPMAAGSLEGCYGVTSSGQIAKGSDKAWMNGYRAYLTGIPDGSSVKMFVIDGDDATDVGLMQMVEGEDKAVYNISGQRVQKARKGLYIIGGKKVIIK